MRLSWVPWLLLTACAGTAAPTADHSGDLCMALVRAAPSDWAERLPLVLALGTDAAPFLVAALQKEPDASGGQAAVAALGHLANPMALPLLRELHRDRGPLAVEATLALATLALAPLVPAEQKAPMVDALTATMGDRLADPTLRTASACSLVALGEPRAAAPLWRAVLLAGTPKGLPLQAELGLPDRPRWAIERWLLQRQLLRSAGTDFGLDTDAPWAEMERTADRVASWLETGR